MILLVDNYDSFTYNLLHYVEQLSHENVVVKRNDEIKVDEIHDYKSFIFSPGPGLPTEAGLMNEIIRKYAPTKPMLGICLGHQAIGEIFGSKLKNLDKVLHGVQRTVSVIKQDDVLFKNIPNQFSTGHYHSWVIDKNSVSNELEITATDEKGNIMAISHKQFPVHGLQFHPESVMTGYGLQIIGNWLTKYN